ncbi:MAG: DUF72 domain-containing protein [Ferruginibacter sp.]
MKKRKWHIGCSGFQYREWKDVFYPEKLPQRKWFEYYSTQFNTLELNVTFYRFPQLKSLQNWYNTSPPDFNFSVKAPRLITHYKQFNDCERLLNDFYGTITEGLKDKAGSILFQLPPKFTYITERLEMIIDNMRSGFKNTVEFRHASWWNEEVYKRLKENSIAFCGISHPTLPADALFTNVHAYYRFHGVPRLYYSVYDNAELKKIADQLLAAKNLEELFVYFNNTAAIGAIENAMWLKNYVQNTQG